MHRLSGSSFLAYGVCPAAAACVWYPPTPQVIQRLAVVKYSKISSPMAAWRLLIERHVLPVVETRSTKFDKWVACITSCVYYEAGGLSGSAYLHALGTCPHLRP